DTKPELAVRRRLHAAGLRYRVNARPEKDLRRTVDILFRPARVVVLIDGCYWHGCQEHYIAPKANGGYWSDKVATNRTRDAETTRVP
ncbi:very short patch repair endonuclease, partial [Acinetobacter baumannii]|nr:very short patch repair endonuclease [Acinetobacter baumannii]